MSEQPTWEQYVSEFLNADEVQQQGLWTQAEIALEVREHYGKEALSKFASEVMRSTITLQKYARTAAFFPRGTRVDHLSFTHHRISANHCPGTESAQTAIGHAADNEWSTRQLQSWLLEVFGLDVSGTLHDIGDEGMLLDNENVVTHLRRFAGLHVRLQVKVTAEED